MEITTNETDHFDVAEILTYTTDALHNLTNSKAKAVKGLDLYDLEQIKSSLVNVTVADDHTERIKNSIIADLNDFKEYITVSYIKDVEAYKKQKIFYERQINVLETQKRWRIIELLSKISWPFDESVNELESQIEVLRVRVLKCAQRILQAGRIRPRADVKDVLMYQLELRKKYAKAA